MPFVGKIMVVWESHCTIAARISFFNHFDRFKIGKQPNDITPNNIIVAGTWKNKNLLQNPVG